MTIPPKSDYDEYPRTLPRDDVWGQVRRTIKGRRISDAEVQQIISAITAALALAPDDVLLDLACGNGALTTHLFADCGGVVGVDSSAYLIEIAQERFSDPPRYAFVQDDIVHFLRSVSEPQRFTKALCYASMQFLSLDDLTTMLTEIRQRFPGVQRLMLGNVPDRDRAPQFLQDNPDIASLDLDDPRAQAGMWWSHEELAALASRCGWESAQISRLSPDVFNARYRYDLTLTRG